MSMRLGLKSTAENRVPPPCDKNGTNRRVRMAGYGAAGEHGEEAQDLALLESLPPSVVAALNEPFQPAPEQREAFERDGFCLVKQLLPPLLLQTLREAIAAHTYRRNPRTLPLSERNTYDRAFIQVGGMWQHGGCAKALTFSKRLASTAAGLMGTHGALLHHDQALFKEPGGGHTPWHCDQQVRATRNARLAVAYRPSPKRQHQQPSCAVGD
jgi:hypothetical protein